MFKKQSVLWIVVLTNSATAIVAVIATLVLGKVIKMALLFIIGGVFTWMGLRYIRTKIQQRKKETTA